MFILLLVVLLGSCENRGSNKNLSQRIIVIDESHYAFLNSPRDILPYDRGYFVVTKEGGVSVYDDSMHFEQAKEMIDSRLYEECVSIIRSYAANPFNADSTYKEILNEMGVPEMYLKRLYRRPNGNVYWGLLSVQGVMEMQHEEYGVVKGIMGYPFIGAFRPEEASVHSLILLPLELTSYSDLVVNPSNAFLINDSILYTNLLVSPYRERFEKVASFSLDTKKQVATLDRVHSIAKHPSNMEAIYGEELYTVESFFESKEGEVMYVNGGEIVNLTANTIDYQVDCDRCILYDAGYIEDEIYGLIMEKDEEKFTSRLYLQNMENPDEIINVDHETHFFGKFYGGKWYNMTKDDEKVYLTIMGVE